MNSHRLQMKVEIDLGINGEFHELINEVETELYKEVNGEKVVLIPEFDTDLIYITQDILKLKSEANLINLVYRSVNYPYQAIELIREMRKEEDFSLERAVKEFGRRNQKGHGTG